MQRFIITTLLVLASFAVRADEQLILTKVESASNLYSLFENRDLAIHYYNDSFIVASLAEGKTMTQESIVLDKAAFSDCKGYYIVYCEPSQRQVWLDEVASTGKVLYSDDNLLIMKPMGEKSPPPPAKNDGMVYIPQRQASLPQRAFDFPKITEIDPLALFLMGKINADSIIATVQHLEDYGTRAYNEPQAYEAETWLQTKFETMGLDVEIQDVVVTDPYYFYPYNTSSGNVIAVQTGTKYPDQYIVCGCHYDSWSWYPITQYVAPGADDNATGAATVVEMARILSQYESEYSIVYCCFAAEEFGLYGSEAYATRCSQQEMDIIGYFNIDMSGYLKPGTDIHISLIYPSTAAPLANYLLNVAEYYYPDIPITSYPNLAGGDSDHTSFNENGYMGIWTFEDWNNDSPYIHSADDVVGLSVNNPDQCRVFAQMNFASMATLAGINYTTSLPIPAFSAQETTIMEGESVQFTDLSINDPTEWHWYFEGGTPAESVEQYPEVLYATPGKYDVKLVVTNSSGNNELLRQMYITVKTLPPIADFVADATEIEEGETVTFTNLSQNNPKTFSWFFENGTPMQSTQENPVVLFSKAGTFSVQLKATNDGGTSTELKENYITVTPKTAIAEHDATDGIMIYPNPTSGELTICDMRYATCDMRYAIIRHRTS